MGFSLLGSQSLLWDAEAPTDIVSRFELDLENGDTGRDS